MKLVEPVLQKDVIDYDFLFTHGVKLPITLDLSLGDRADEETERFIIHLASKPSRYDSEEVLPAETAYVYKRNLVALIIRERKQRIPTEEEQFDMKETIQSLAKSVM